MKKKISEILFREDLYPRLEKDLKKVQEYSENIELMPPILINQDNILIDGWHRKRACEIANVKEFEVIVEKTQNDNEIYLRAIETNSTHGLQLSNKDKKSVAVKMYDGKNAERLRKALSISERSFRDWTSNKRKQMDDERNDKIMELYLKCWTQQQIADDVGGITQVEVGRTIESFKQNGKNAEMFKMSKFEPFLYNIWGAGAEEDNPGVIKGAYSIDDDNKHYGKFPQTFMENLLYYWTKPFSVVYDPFTGGGVTIDVCKKWFRRYYVSDAFPLELRKDEIKQWKIQDGLPKDMPTPDFVFLDPPYWLQAKEKYSKDKDDLGNMNLDGFYESLSNFIKALKTKMKDGYVGFVISPTQYPNKNKEFEDHIIKIMTMFEKYGFKEVMRYMLPYSSEQYNGNQVDIAKKEKICLSLIRDLVVFKKQ